MLGKGGRFFDRAIALIQTLEWFHELGTFPGLPVTNRIGGKRMDPAVIQAGKSVGSAPETDHFGEQELLQRAQSGDHEAFCLLVSQHQSRLFSSVYRVVGHMEDAQDVVQEAFLNAFLSLRQFKGDSRFFTWIYRIALNVAISHRRKAMSRLNARMRTIDDSQGTVVPLASGAQADADMAIQDDARMIQAALEHLSPDHRAVLVMKDMEDMRYEAMAEVLEIPVGTVRSRLHRARLELRNLLENQDSFKKGGGQT